MYDLRRNGDEQPGHEGRAGGAPGKRQPTDRIPAQPQPEPQPEPQAQPQPPAFAGFANHVEDPSRDPFANDDPFGFHLLGPKRVTTGVNVRSSPKVADDNRVAGYDAGHVVNVVARQGEWALIMHGGHPAYVHGKYLEDVHAAAAPPKAAPKIAPKAGPQLHPAKHEPIEPAKPVEDHKGIDDVIARALASGHPSAIALATQLRTAAELQAHASKGSGRARAFGKNKETKGVGLHEEQGEQRQQLVASIAKLRKSIGALPPELAGMRPGFYQAVQDIAPYYQQWNEDLILPNTQARTCNITSFSMALESLGKTAADYTGNPRHLAIAAQTLTKKPMEKDALLAMRLPDFMQIAYVAICMKGESESDVMAAWQTGADSLTSGTFMASVARFFGVNGDYQVRKDADELSAQGNPAFHGLEDQHVKHRRDAMMVLGRQRRDDKKSLGKTRADFEKQMDMAGAEKSFPIVAYTSWVKANVGAELASGAAVVVGMGGGSGHFVRVQAVHDDHIVMDDPGSWDNANLKVAYEEARAMGAFWNRIVLRG